MKYVMFRKKDKELSIYHPVIFPNHMIHADVAEYTHYALPIPLIGWEVVSSGEYNVMTGDCSGKSESLNLKSNPERDTYIIRMNDYGGGMTADSFD